MKEISVKVKEPFLQRYSSLASVLTIGLMAAVYISKDKIIVSISGAALLALLSYSFFEIQRSKNIDLKTKRASWWVILVATSIIGAVYFKLT